MRQVIQSLNTGAVEAAEAPAPGVSARGVLIDTRVSLVSAGTERMLLEFGRGNLLQKAMQQPHRVREVLAKASTDGLLETMAAVRSKLDEPVPLGYCNAGVVAEVGAAVTRFRPGDRVVSNAPHAERVCVAETLCAKIPDRVSDVEAAFAPLAAIALQGVRLAAPTLGERVAVIGLGLVGLLTVQILRAHGCRVLGVDLDPERVRLAVGFGAQGVDLSAGQDPVAAACGFSEARGVDAVLVAASTASQEPMRQAARMCRQRGRVVLVGVAGLRLNRADFYEKELTFQVSCSYGPGRHDPAFEQQGQDYPFGFVRWTEQRNFEAVLQLMADGGLEVLPLVSHAFEIGEAPQAYEALASDPRALGVTLAYPERGPARRDRTVRLGEASGAAGPCERVAVIGAGQFASRTLLPAFAKAGARLVSVASLKGLSAVLGARRHGAASATTDVDAVILDPAVDALAIATRHDSHASLALRGIEAGKAVFVEKPLALAEAELDRLQAALQAAAEGPGPAPLLMVGFNRRFAPLGRRMKRLLDQTAGPKTFVATVNAGALPREHWAQDSQAGGGRIVGEACHFIDFLRFLTGAPILTLSAVRVDGPEDGVADDKATLVMTFADGSHGTVHYFANGSKGFPKERIEAFGQGRVLQLDNFRVLRGWGWPGFRRASGRQDKGHAACVAAFMDALRSGGAPPIPPEEILEVSRWAIRAAAFPRG